MAALLLLAACVLAHCAAQATARAAEGPATGLPAAETLGAEAAGPRLSSRVLRTFFNPRGRRAVSTPTPDDLWYRDQIVDHFDPTNQETWSQRYYVNATHYRPGGPLFLMIGGEGEIGPRYVGDTYSIDYFAQRFHGMKVALEHRYYGLSFPRGNSDDLRLLNSRQALADMARFLAFIKRDLVLPEGTKVIVIGGSYPGNLAAWARLQFPFLIDGAISSSAPVLAQGDYPEYMEHVEAQVRKYGGEACVDAIHQATLDIESLYATNKTLLASLLGLDADTFDTFDDYDFANFMGTFTAPCGVVQYANHDGYYEDTPSGDIKQMCEDIQARISEYRANGTLVQRAHAELMGYTDWTLADFGATSWRQVDFSFANYVEHLKDSSMLSEYAVDRSWMWQTCGDAFGYYQTSEDPSKMFGSHVTLELFLQMCYKGFFEDQNFTRAQFDSFFEEQVRATNNWYGARNIPRDNIYYTNGEVDPWGRLGISPECTWAQGQYYPESCELEMIENGSHCTDLYMRWKVNDAVREREAEFIERVLEQ